MPKKFLMGLAVKQTDVTLAQIPENSFYSIGDQVNFRANDGVIYRVNPTLLKRVRNNQIEPNPIEDPTLPVIKQVKASNWFNKNTYLPSMVPFFGFRYGVEVNSNPTVRSEIGAYRYAIQVSTTPDFAVTYPCFESYSFGSVQIGSETWYYIDPLIMEGMNQLASMSQNNYFDTPISNVMLYCGMNPITDCPSIVPVITDKMYIRVCIVKNNGASRSVPVVYDFNEYGSKGAVFEQCVVNPYNEGGEPTPDLAYRVYMAENGAGYSFNTEFEILNYPYSGTPPLKVELSYFDMDDMNGTLSYVEATPTGVKPLEYSAVLPIVPTYPSIVEFLSAQSDDANYFPMKYVFFSARITYGAGVNDWIEISGINGVSGLGVITRNVTVNNSND